MLVDGGASNQTYQMTDRGIVWPGEKNKYAATPTPPDQLVPPPFWRGSFTNAPGAYNYPNGYTADNIFNPSEDEHFMVRPAAAEQCGREAHTLRQVWMRTAGLPTFRKLYYRNDNDVMLAGRYIITITDSACASRPLAARC